MGAGREGRQLNTVGTKIEHADIVGLRRSVMNLDAICKASPFLSGLTFAAEDFALDLSITRTPDLHEFMYARSAIVTAARAHNLPSTLDLVSTTFRGEEGKRALASESENGKRFGFNGKQCIHPDQVETVQSVFSPELLEEVYKRSRGIPRLINLICDNLLVTAFAMEQRQASLEMLDEVSQDLRLEWPGGGRDRRGRSRIEQDSEYPDYSETSTSRRD